MPKVHCFTSASFAYLDRVRVLAATLKTYNPEWELTLCLSDQEPSGWRFDTSAEQIDHLVRISELDIEDLQRFIFDHNVIELCTAVKGAMLSRLFAQGAEKVVYLDPDIAVFGSLDELSRLLDHHDILLTPHQLSPDDDISAIADNEMGSLKYGIYNLGFIAVANTSEGQRFSQWWARRLAIHCFDEVANGLFTDQKWCDLVPAFFAGAHILRDPGYNVASWNLSQRPISIDENGTVYAGGSPLKFFHFTKIDWAGEVAIENYARGQIETFELLSWYKNLLVLNKPIGLPERYWAYSIYADGSAISDEHRLQYRTDRALREKYPDPFAAGAAIFENT
ncbi:hypothetical protein AB4Y85_13865 [Microvirga sp. 2YAF29]|uniref:hypothetical protein n=1 Tax=Microvirga sp. 2YAF29 TaxID=3233031 RepID=UPI003F9CF3A3